MSAIGLLGVVFVTLKLCGVIGWSWLWVTVPFWGGVAFWLAFMLFAFAMAAITGQTRVKRGRGW